MNPSHMRGDFTMLGQSLLGYDEAMAFVLNIVYYRGSPIRTIMQYLLTKKNELSTFAQCNKSDVFDVNPHE